MIGFGKICLNFNLSKTYFKWLFFSVLGGLNPFRGHVMEKKLSITYCRKVLEKSGRENLTDEQVERIRDALYVIADVQINYSKSREGFE